MCRYIPFGMAVLLYVLVREWSQRVPPTANAAVRRAHRGVIRRVKAAYSFALLMFLSRAYYLLYDNEVQLIASPHMTRVASSQVCSLCIFSVAASNVHAGCVCTGP